MKMGEKFAFARWVRYFGCTGARHTGVLCPGCLEDWRRGWR